MGHTDPSGVGGAETIQSRFAPTRQIRLTRAVRRIPAPLRRRQHLAYERLSTADSVTFIGYSFPPTDAAARVLFEEALADLPPTAIGVVSLETDDAQIDTLKSRYRDVLGQVPDACFFLDGARAWVQQRPTPGSAR